MSTILENVDDTETGYGKRLMTKGGAEGILELCTHYLNENGDKEDITPQKKKDFEQWIQRYAEDALRCIGLAYKDLNPHEGGQDHDEMSVDKVNRVVEKGGFTLICVLGIRDILRDHVKEAVKTCQSAQVAVRMVTGDNKITATAIAKDCGILPENYKPHPEYGMYEVTTGPEFAQRVGGIQNPGAGEAEVVANKEEFAMYRKHLKVLARSRPDDKYLLVTGLKQFEDVVAVTGDGTNDAPALKKADVGFAMGIAGTDVAKHACDIIIMDDSFASIVVACKWGRNIYDNIRRFLQFQLTVNLCALVSAFIGSCILQESPLKSIQLLWVNLIMDSLASLALATEEPTDELLKRAPQSRTDYIISRKMTKHIWIMSTWMSFIVFFLVFQGENFIPEEEGYVPQVDGYIQPGRKYTLDGEPLWEPYEKLYGTSRHYTIVFTVFVFLQIFNMICSRKINDEKNVFDGFFRNKMYVGIIFIITIVQIIITQFTADVFKVARGGLSPTQWIICILLSASVLPVNFAIKFLSDSFGVQLGSKERKIDESGFIHQFRSARTVTLTKKTTNRFNRMGSSVKN